MFVRRLTWLDTGETTLCRYTMVLTLEDGTWRVVHRHASMPRANVDVFGKEHLALKRLAEEVERSGGLRGRTGLAAVMFTDVVDSTRLAAEAGDGAWAARIRGHFAQVRGLVESHGGDLVKSLGDGTMSAFGSAREAVRAACAIQAAAEADGASPRLRLRVRIDAGDVVAADADVFGTVVNRAARIAGSAEPGTIRVSEAVSALAGGLEGAVFGPRLSLVMKGVDGEQSVREVLRGA